MPGTENHGYVPEAFDEIGRPLQPKLEFSMLLSARKNGLHHLVR